MKLVQTTVSVAKAEGDSADIHDARFDMLAMKLVDLFRAAGWDRSVAIRELINELNEVDADIAVAADRAARGGNG